QGLVRSFAGTHSLAELEGLSAVELLQRALRAAPQQAVEIGVCRVIGHVREEDRAYVLFWLGTEEGPVLTDEPAIATVDRVDGEWRLVLDPSDRRGMPGFRNWVFAEARETGESDRSE
ncbi:MAG TPA: hypothetical protein VK864_01305, partial [Longimicrobiales bacterium]|nr:hypothetical protein [Longimicrobiales bacterium]